MPSISPGPGEKLQQAVGCFHAHNLAGTERLCREILGDAPDHPDALHLLGVVRLIGGDSREAVSLIGRALQVRPQDPAMLENLGVAHLAASEAAQAEALFRSALAQGASHALLHMRLGLALAAQGRHGEAVSALQAAAGQAPGEPEVHLNLGNTLAELGQATEAQACYHKVLALQPDHAVARFNLGNLFRRTGRLGEAEAAFRQALLAAPRDPDIHNNLGLLYEQQRRLEEAESCFRQALTLSAGHLHAWNNLGNVLRAQKRLDEAVACFEQVLSAAPDHVDAQINLGSARAEQGRYAEAQPLYEKVLRQDPRSFEAHYNLGGLLKLQGRLAEAIVHYRHALDADPKRAMAWSDLGAAYRQAGDLDSAVACFRKASELDPGHADTDYDLAETFKLQGRLDSALDSYGRALALDPGHALALGGLVHVRQHVCRWEGIEELWARVRAGIAAGSGDMVTPFSALSMPTSAAEQLACARAWARRELAPAIAARSGLGFDFSAPRRRERLRIGYLSWGFHRHATAYLTAELFERHNRDRFEVFAYAYGPDDASAIRARIRGACEHFVDVSRDSHTGAARRIYDDGVDVLVDLTGHTLGARTPILALRPAPVQVNWLGYPGTLGTDCVDYLVADPFIVPAGQEACYAEKVVRLPDCYQITDSRREVADRVPTREECGLPARGFVFCCFNQAYKILPETFRLWMRVLRAVPGSVLWLAEANPWMAGSLRRAANEGGVAPERLVFAPRRPLAEYLTQYRLADLALDTFPYTSHTTASDALWMGCPLVTRAGETFASRVAGSILLGAGMRELVTETPGDCERVVVELATSPGKLLDIRRRLAETRDTCPLFDTPRFVRNLEDAYGVMFNAYLDGKR
ncbi:MAG: tetratricopeptide repeat protein [Betaproteobacteria bacterium]|nr:tetratricopeptide repeat protein [Betaproteobacteria bacterium]